MCSGLASLVQWLTEEAIVGLLGVAVSSFFAWTGIGAGVMGALIAYEVVVLNDIWFKALALYGKIMGVAEGFVGAVPVIMSRVALDLPALPAPTLGSGARHG